MMGFGKRWKKAELVRRALAEAAGGSPENRDPFTTHMHVASDFHRNRKDRRNDFIQIIEVPGHKDLGILVKVVEVYGARHGLSEIEIAHEAAARWNERRKRSAMSVLFAYGKIR